jgi:hypothetical protein
MHQRIINLVIHKDVALLAHLAGLGWITDESLPDLIPSW